MRGRRLIFISMLAIFLVIGISLGSASALDFDDYNGTWYKIKARLNGVCEDLEFELSNESAKEYGNDSHGWNSSKHDQCKFP